MKTGYLVHDAMTTKPITCSKDLSLRDCAALMRNHGVGSVLVVKGDVLLGLLTEEDFVYKVVADSLSIDEPISKIMVSSLITISPKKDIGDALHLMNKHEIRHLPVVDDDKLVGFITLGTVLKIEPQLFELMAERFELRGIRPGSPIIDSFGSVLGEGQCEECGNYSSNLVDVDGVRICPNCSKK